MSKGLEALKRLRNYKPYDIEPNLDIIEEELKEKWKLEQAYNSLQEYNNFVLKNMNKVCTALEIIKKKKVNMFAFYECCSWHNPSHYNDSIGCPINCELTREEYDLLKEILSNV